MKPVYLYLIAMVIFFALDMLWLGLIAKNLYQKKLAFVISPDVNWPAAIVFYLLYIGGILFFAIYPALRESHWQTALLHGALLGGLCYATYDLTNMVTIKGWPLIITVVDIAWGMVITGTTAFLSYLLANKFL
jgi:uncharacterized membrane protein